MSKGILRVSILLTGMLLGTLHYVFKPPLDEKVLQQYSQDLTNTTEWQGRIAPDFEMKTNRGENFQLSENVGKRVIVLNFFATWCGPCREEMPELNSYFDAHKADSFLLVGIDAEESQDRVDGFLSDLKVDFPAGIDSGSIRKQYGVEAFPTTVLIGVDGKVQFYETGALSNAEVAFDNLLGKNRTLLQSGQVISQAEYRVESEKQPALTVRKITADASSDDDYKLDARGQRIIARMDCPCGCDKKVHGCTCNTSGNIKKALSNEDFKDQPDDEIIRSLNKRFCSGAM